MLLAKNIHKAFTLPTKTHVLRGLDLEVGPGETVAIMGKSGEGKSTLLHILGSLESPTSGQLEFLGKPYRDYDLAELRSRHIGFIFQAFNLLEEYTVLDNVLMPAKIARQPVGKGSPAYAKAVKLLEWVGLAHRAAFPAKLLSGGEKQRTAIARALINDADLLLADEPSGNLDSATSEEIYKLLLSGAKMQRKALVVVTHDQTLADLCDRTLILRQGLICNF